MMGYCEHYVVDIPCCTSLQKKYNKKRPLHHDYMAVDAFKPAYDGNTHSLNKGSAEAAASTAACIYEFRYATVLMSSLY